MFSLQIRSYANSFSLACWICLFLGLERSSAQDIQAIAPVSVPPSTEWDGNDGRWSSFTLQIGSPPQVIRVLPSSSGSAVWTVVADGCTPQDPSGCRESRGTIFDPEDSSTWVHQGTYVLSLEAEIAFGYSGNGLFGYDSVVLSGKGGGGATVNDSVIAGIATKDFYIGTLGLSPYGTNFSGLNGPKASMLKLLRDSGQIPSRSWAYTAGASYSPKQTFGSLLLGGYDASRFVPNNLTIGLAQDISRDILVGVQSIRSGEASLLDQAIVAFIDSTIPHMWLPLQVCQNFERAFGLTWDAELELYLINDTLHAKLFADNPTVTLTIASSINGGDMVDIEMPYGAFDLEASEPVTPNGTSHYYPLKRAQNQTQYALGRVFLQAAYLIVDYDRNNFSVSQAVFPDTRVDERRIPILDPSQHGTENAQKADDQIATSAIVGIFIGAIVAVLVVVAGAVLYFRRRRADRLRRQFQEGASAIQPPFWKPELDAKDTAVDETTEPSDKAQTAELAGSSKHADELSGQPLVEAAEDRALAEMSASGAGIAELEGSGGERTNHQLL